MYGMPGKSAGKSGAHASVIELPMNTTRTSSGAGGVSAALAARYRSRLAQSVVPDWAASREAAASTLSARVIDLIEVAGDW